MCHLFDYNLEWHCLECQPGYELWVDGCFASCPAGQFRYGYECGSCTQHCSQCTGPMSHECVRCEAGYVFDFRRMCVPECRDGTYPAPDGEGCLSCNPFCRTCIAGTQLSCKTCFEGYAMRVLEPTTQTGECMAVCPRGFFRDAPDDLRCMQCARYCTSCESQENCFECQAGAALYRGKCYLVPARLVRDRIDFQTYLDSGAGKQWDDKDAPTWEMIQGSASRSLEEQPVLASDAGWVAAKRPLKQPP